MTYTVKIRCGNCCFKNKYEIGRETSVDDAGLICPNCGCSPTSQDYVILYEDKLYGKAVAVEDKEQRPQNGRPDKC